MFYVVYVLRHYKKIKQLNKKYLLEISSSWFVLLNVSILDDF